MAHTLIIQLSSKRVGLENETSKLKDIYPY